MSDMALPNILLVTLDSLAAHHMSLYGYRRRTTPRIDRFAEAGYVFESVYAGCNASTPSVLSLLTGCYPSKRLVFQKPLEILSGNSHSKSLVGVLQSHGYVVAGLIGTNYGYIALNTERRTSRGPGESVGRLALNSSLLFGTSTRMRPIFERARNFLFHTPKPTFLWLHVIAPHEPYLPSDRFRNTFLREPGLETRKSQRHYMHRFYREAEQSWIDKLRDRYDEMVLNVDHECGMFLESLEQSGWLKGSIVAVTSDHGEMFERGYQGHKGPYLYQAMLRIPLMIRLPNQVGAERVLGNAAQVDLAPTILDLLEIEVPYWMEGESLRHAMNTRHCLEKPIFAMTERVALGSFCSSLSALALVQEEFKLITNLGSGGCELYNLSRDPCETNNLVHEERFRAEAMTHILRGRFPGGA